jgi:hypothetical protein
MTKLACAVVCLSLLVAIGSGRWPRSDDNGDGAETMIGLVTTALQAAPLLEKCSGRSVQCRSIFGHAKRNCASEAYEPPLRFGMIVSSKAATSSNSTRYSSNSSVAPDGLK